MCRSKTLKATSHICSTLVNFIAPSFLIFFLLSCDNSSTKREFPRLIAHGGGQIDEYIYTNSKEAVLSAIDHGYKLIELDFMTTSDGFMVAVHDWTLWNKMTGNKDLLPDLKTFKETKLFGKYTSLDFVEVNRIFQENPKVTLVTDKTRDLVFLKENYYDLERIMVEIFTDGDLIKARDLGFKYLIPTQFWNKENYVDFLLENEVKYVGLGTWQLEKNKSKVVELNRLGIKIYCFTINGTDELKNQFDNGGIYGAYTDSILPKELSSLGTL